MERIRGHFHSVIKLMMWGNISTDMFRTYAHVTGQDIDTAMLKSYGFSVMDNGNAASQLEPVQCLHHPEDLSSTIELLLLVQPASFRFCDRYGRGNPAERPQGQPVYPAAAD